MKTKIINVPTDLGGALLGSSQALVALKKEDDKHQQKIFSKYSLCEIPKQSDTGINDKDFVSLKNAKQILTTLKNVANNVCDTIDNGDFPLVISGDHSSAAGVIMGAHNSINKEIGIIYIDAHADLHSPFTSPSGNIHGMPLAIVAQVDNKENTINTLSNSELKYWSEFKNISNNPPAINPSNIVFCALRDMQKEEEFLLQKFNIKNYTTREITKIGIDKTIQGILDKLSHCTHICVSFDIDSMDSSLVKGTGTPVKNGLSLEQAIQLNNALAKNKKVISYEITELNPTIDINNQTSQNTYKILTSIINGIENRQ